MASWPEFALLAPEYAAFGKLRFESGVAYLATVRSDGSPRVHPVTPIVGEQLFLFMKPTSPKRTDLRHDARYQLHSSVEDMSGGGGEFYVRGHGAFTDDAIMREQATRACPYIPKDYYVLYWFTIEFAFLNKYIDGRATPERWQAPDSTPHPNS